MELSNLCDQKIFAVIYDEAKQRLVYYSSDGAFDIDSANQALKKCYKPHNFNKFEVYTNDDYERLAILDYRRVRYLKKTRCKNYEIKFLDGQPADKNILSEDEDGSDDDSEIKKAEGLSQSSQSATGSPEGSLAKKRGGRKS
eukprot:CAMPEP_0170498296 /NCGR_PEP_ID=MMETSP0208-20121228/27384_1 /TAXON_ID=197538 /ORGANISM="Strombidium inclinatum, Strain S3" /LENGTH=141 /DNA_ID=CAMNT_0010775429 /DNA_START=42 /DNA_END=467 /DNA_ORIENTATION=+